MLKALTGLAFAAVGLLPPGVDGDRVSESPQASPTADAIATAMRFHAALARADSAAATALLEPDAMILESGDVETRAEYIAHHLGADIEFARGLPSKRTIVQTRRSGNVVWIVATSESKGRFQDRELDSRGAELMVLSKSGAEWQIRAIHWSSHRNPTSQ